MNFESMFGVVFYVSAIVGLFFMGPFFRFLSIILALSFLYVWVNNK